MDEVSAFQQASNLFADLVTKVGVDQWTAPTPDTEWDVRALVNHVAGEWLWVPDLVEGKTIAEVGDKYAGDVLGLDPAEATKRAAEAAQVAFGAPGALDHPVHLSFGDTPARDYLGQMTIDAVIHSWDLAMAIGADNRPSPELASYTYELFKPQAETWRQPGVLAVAVEVSDTADDLTKLIGLSGRNPQSWA